MAPDEDVISAAPATHYRVELTQTKETYECLPHETLLQGMRHLQSGRGAGQLGKHRTDEPRACQRGRRSARHYSRLPRGTVF